MISLMYLTITRLSGATELILIPEGPDLFLTDFPLRLTQPLYT